MMLYAYCALGHVDAYLTRGIASDVVHRIEGMFTQTIRRVDLDRSIADGGSGYYTTPVRAIEAFIARAEAALAPGGSIAAGARRDWTEALDIARRVLTTTKAKIN
jgi:hypothetical protein